MWCIFGHTYLDLVEPFSSELLIFLFLQTDKVSMLDEAIDYLKSLQLQLQVQIASNIRYDQVY